MSLTILSPHSGQPVMVRDQDINRAIRDEGGRLFYVVPRADGSGHYGSLTRKGSPADEARYDNQDWKLKDAQPAQPVAAAASKPHDATGKRKLSPVRVAAVVLIALLLMVVAVFTYRAFTDSDTPINHETQIEPLPSPSPDLDPERPMVPDPSA